MLWNDPKRLFLTWVQQFSWNIRHKLHTYSIYPLGQKSGLEFFGSSKECCSSWSEFKNRVFSIFSIDSTKLSSAMKWPKRLFLTWVQQFSWNIQHKLHTYSIYPLGQNGGQEFFGSSEECCSSWSGCCNSSCAGSCGDQQPLQQKLQDTPHQQPLSAAMVVMQVSSSYTVLVFVEFSVQICNKLKTGYDL